jgi:hypothetical protein
MPRKKILLSKSSMVRLSLQSRGMALISGKPGLQRAANAPRLEDQGEAGSAMEGGSTSSASPSAVTELTPEAMVPWVFPELLIANTASCS